MWWRIKNMLTCLVRHHSVLLNKIFSLAWLGCVNYIKSNPICRIFSIAVSSRILSCCSLFFHVFSYQFVAINFWNVFSLILLETKSYINMLWFTESKDSFRSLQPSTFLLLPPSRRLLFQLNERWKTQIPDNGGGNVWRLRHSVNVRLETSLVRPKSYLHHPIQIYVGLVPKIRSSFTTPITQRWRLQFASFRLLINGYPHSSISRHAASLCTVKTAPTCL